MTLHTHDIHNLCATVGDFAQRQSWLWEAKSVVSFEFVRLADYAIAYHELMNTIVRETTFQGRAPHHRVIDNDTVELDCYGVTFRLKCVQRIATPQGGSVGAGDLQTSDSEHVTFLKGLAQLRKQSDY
jgi:hypothetical protein